MEEAKLLFEAIYLENEREWIVTSLFFSVSDLYMSVFFKSLYQGIIDIQKHVHN